MSTAGWVEYWGAGNPERWLEKELGLATGEYDLRLTDRRLLLADPKEPRDRDLDVYELRDREGRTRAVAMTELSNGIWVVAYEIAEGRA